MKCKDCTNWGCLRRASDAQKDCYYEQCAAKEFDWQSFRNQVAKDILCQVITLEEVTVALTKARVSKEKAVSIAIDYADELIKQPKQKQE